MTAEQSPHVYDPLWDAPRRKMSPATIVALVIVVLLHIGLVFWLWKTKIEAKQETFDDQAVQVTLTRPPPPPPRLKLDEHSSQQLNSDILYLQSFKSLCS